MKMRMERKKQQMGRDKFILRKTGREGYSSLLEEFRVKYVHRINIKTCNTTNRTSFAKLSA